jgi:hypothetical protein
MKAEALRLLGITKQDLTWVKDAPGYAAAQSRLAHVKDVAKSNYKTAAKALHPDKTGNDPEQTKLFRTLKDIYDRIQATEIEALSTEELVIPLAGSNLVLVSDAMGRFELQFCKEHQ